MRRPRGIAPPLVRCWLVAARVRGWYHTPVHDKPRRRPCLALPLGWLAVWRYIAVAGVSLAFPCVVPLWLVLSLAPWEYRGKYARFRALCNPYNNTSNAAQYIGVSLLPVLVRVLAWLALRRLPCGGRFNKRRRRGVVLASTGRRPCPLCRGWCRCPVLARCPCLSAWLVSVCYQSKPRPVVSYSSLFSVLLPIFPPPVTTGVYSPVTRARRVFPCLVALLSVFRGYRVSCGYFAALWRINIRQCWPSVLVRWCVFAAIYGGIAPPCRWCLPCQYFKEIRPLRGLLWPCGVSRPA